MFCASDRIKKNKYFFCPDCRSVPLGVAAPSEDSVFTRNQRSGSAATVRHELRTGSMWWALWAVQGNSSSFPWWACSIWTHFLSYLCKGYDMSLRWIWQEWQCFLIFKEKFYFAPWSNGVSHMEFAQSRPQWNTRESKKCEKSAAVFKSCCKCPVRKLLKDGVMWHHFSVSKFYSHVHFHLAQRLQPKCQLYASVFLVSFRAKICLFFSDW